MSTTTTITRGSEWGFFLNVGVYSSWGECGLGADQSATYLMLGDRVVQRFEQIAAEQGFPVSWVPGSSEVVGDARLDLTGADFDGWRERAVEEIWEQWMNGDIEPVKANQEETEKC